LSQRTITHKVSETACFRLHVKDILKMEKSTKNRIDKTQVKQW